MPFTHMCHLAKFPDKLSLVLWFILKTKCWPGGSLALVKQQANQEASLVCSQCCGTRRMPAQICAVFFGMCVTELYKLSEQNTQSRRGFRFHLAPRSRVTHKKQQCNQTHQQLLILLNPFSICNWTFEIILSCYDKMLKETVTSFFYKHAFGTKNLFKSQYSTVYISMEEFSYSRSVCFVLIYSI